MKDSGFETHGETVTSPSTKPLPSTRSKRTVITQHDFDLIEWLVRYYRENNPMAVRFPAHQNLDELLRKLKPEEKQ